MRDQSPATRAAGVQDLACSSVASDSRAQLFARDLPRTDGYLDAYAQTLTKRRYLTCKHPDAYSSFTLQESKTPPELS